MSALTLSDIGLFKGMMAKMDWLDQRQKVLANNVANADTPNFRPSELKKVDFGALMNVQQGAGATLHQASTNNAHLGGINEYSTPKDVAQRSVYESSFDDNGVILEEQMMKASRNAGDYNMITNLYRRQIGMIKTAIGTQR